MEDTRFKSNNRKFAAKISEIVAFIMRYFEEFWPDFRYRVSQRTLPTLFWTFKILSISYVKPYILKLTQNGEK